MNALPALILVAVFLPLLAAPLMALAGRRLGPSTGWLALGVPAVSGLALLAVAVSVGPQPNLVVRWPWAPSLGLELAFLVDGLSFVTRQFCRCCIRLRRSFFHTSKSGR